MSHQSKTPYKSKLIFSFGRIVNSVSDFEQLRNEINSFKLLCFEYPQIKNLLVEFGCEPNSAFSGSEFYNLMDNPRDANFNRSIMDLLLSENGARIISAYPNKHNLMQAILDVSRNFVSSL